MDLYKKLNKKPVVFRKLTGLNDSEFEIIVKKLSRVENRCAVLRCDAE